MDTSSGDRPRVVVIGGANVYVKARSEHDRRIFSPTEIGLFVLIAFGAVIGGVGLWTGRIESNGVLIPNDCK